MSSERPTEVVRAIETVVGGVLEGVQRHYIIERELADRLRNSTRSERLHLYQELYDLLFQRVPAHPLVTPDLEVRAGDCRLAIAMASHVRSAFAVDVSVEISRRAVLPENCHFVLSTGCDIAVPP